jgi:hypothetical protein
MHRNVCSICYIVPMLLTRGRDPTTECSRCYRHVAAALLEPSLTDFGLRGRRNGKVDLLDLVETVPEN